MSAQEIVEQIYRSGVPTAELVAACMKEAEEEDIQNAAEHGFADLIGHHERMSWRNVNGEDIPSTPRSGHQNSSGRFSGLRDLPRGVNILSIGVRLNDGTALRLGEMDRELLRRWHEEFLARVRGNQAGADFSLRLLRELERSKKKYVRQLGVRRVAEARKASGFRVRKSHKGVAEAEAA